MSRTSWLDEETQEVKIDDYAQQLTSFIEALSDGRVDTSEVAAQEQRVAEIMREVEPQLDDTLHRKMTQLLCELSALNMMQVFQMMESSRPPRQFRG